MPYSGGSSTIAGTNYQNWFLALQCAYAFFEKDFEIFPEALRNDNVIIDDVRVKKRTSETYYSVKLSPPNNSLHWSVSALKSENIFRDFKKQFRKTPKAKLVLVSQSNCYLFAEVFRRGSNASGPADIDDNLNSKNCVELWEEVKEYLEFDDFEMIRFAQQVSIKTIPQDEIELLIKHRFLNISAQPSITSLLFQKSAECAPYKTKISKELINSWFLDENIIFRS